MIGNHLFEALEDDMTLRPTLVAFAAASMTLMASSATAVGDPLVRLSRQRAAAIYERIRSLLEADGMICPVGQALEGGTVTGGSSPAGSSQTTTLMFDRGGKVVINRTWNRGTDKKPAVSIRINCSQSG